MFRYEARPNAREKLDCQLHDEMNDYGFNKFALLAHLRAASYFPNSE